MRYLVAGLALVVLVAACSTAQPTGSNPTPVPTAVPAAAGSAPASPDPTPAGPTDLVRVTLGIYSGRPDPTWTLTGSDAAAVERAIEALPEMVGTPPEGGLGYHGFTVTSPGRVITAYGGTVWVGGGGPGVLRSDPGRTVERLLLELGRTQLAPAEIGEVERSLATP